MTTEPTNQLADNAAKALMAEGRCALTVTRSSQGRVKLEFRTHALGKIDVEMKRGDLEDLLFGVADVNAGISRCFPARKPTYPAPQPMAVTGTPAGPESAAQDGILDALAAEWERKAAPHSSYGEIYSMALKDCALELRCAIMRIVPSCAPAVTVKTSSEARREAFVRRMKRRCKQLMGRLAYCKSDRAVNRAARLLKSAYRTGL